MDEDWESFFQNDEIQIDEKLNEEHDHLNIEEKNFPKCSDIYISTKTKISFFNKSINLNDVFWKIPIISYHLEKEGIIKKQIKINSSSEEELNIIKNKLKEYSGKHFVEEHIITQINNPSGRIKFKDIRKLSIGLRKKDIISHRCKKKSAFYNCFVVILRIEHMSTFKEINVKVFNTGKIEIPGIQTKEMLDKVLVLLTNILNKIEGYEDLNFIDSKNETVLINSNFRCGYYINREKLYNILKYNYNIKCAYDPCSYPGILCEFYYHSDLSNDKQTGRQIIENCTSQNKITKVSFMIFRTGSVLIVGKCEEDILNYIYLFIKNMLIKEYINCYTIISEDEIKIIKEKEKELLDTNIEKNRKIKKNIIVCI